MLLHLGRVLLLVVSSADTAREILKTQDLNFCTRPSLLTLKRLSYNIQDVALAPYNEYWREMRRIFVHKLLSPKRVHSFGAVRAEEVANMVNSISKSCSSMRSVDLAEELLSLTNRVICRIAFGKSYQGRNFDGGKFSEFVHKFMALSGSFSALELHYLKIVVKETLRLHTIAPLLIPRECMNHCKVNGYDISPKTRVMVNVWAIGRNPEYWDNPDMFFPERFEGSSIDYMGQHFEFLPFGAGRRICPAMTMGNLHVELALANLLYCFDWKLPSGMQIEDIDMEEGTGISLHKKSPLLLVPSKYNW
ncbi:hypothetical protein Sjap_002595 [Stephania japonica]|uniref:Cytochrome P450 n=1 Tax=Stephania japonica TaxID=461633 RepID=A0AAP0KPS7_9MAGN